MTGTVLLLPGRHWKIAWHFVPSENQNPTSWRPTPHLLLLWKVQHGTWLVSFPTTAEREWFHLPNIHPPIKHCRHMARNTISRAQLYLITLTLCVCHRSLSLWHKHTERSGYWLNFSSLDHRIPCMGTCFLSSASFALYLKSWTASSMTSSSKSSSYSAAEGEKPWG